ncbi:MAG: hypothetical protein AB1486_28830 [Planctomycetota bacterium]
MQQQGIVFYAGGVEVAQLRDTAVPSTSAQDITIGAVLYTPGTPPPQLPTFFFHGSIDEVSMWNEALSPEAMAAIYRHGIDPAARGLRGFWSFNEQEGQLVLDLSATGNDGSLGTDESEESCDPAWAISRAPTCCLDREICLNIEPD